ncbi:MAG: hypothetical protein M1514_00855, partial [Patescibacteria group bacterium]|nr:hypothetical protein [Patescibacteria group bacterium]
GGALTGALGGFMAEKFGFRSLFIIVGIISCFGTGFIDEKGFFPELYNFLHQNERLPRLISIMEICDFGMAQAGWKTFINFLLEETNQNFSTVVRLLTPTICSRLFFPTLVENLLLGKKEEVAKIREFAVKETYN